MAATIKDVNVRESIIACTEKLISKIGIDKTSLSMIAKDAGISRGTLFYHFPSKSDLMADISEKHISEVTESLLTIIQTNPDKDILELTEILVELVLRDTVRTHLHHHLLKESSSGSETSSQRIAKSYTSWNNILTAEVIKKLEIPESLWVTEKPRIESVSEMVIAILDGLIIQKSIGVSKISAHETAQNILLLLAPEMNLRSSNKRRSE